MNIVCVVGARPNFMKVAPVHAALRARGHQSTLVHTGQHYDQQMSDVFFRDLGMAAPDINLGVGSDSHATQTARVMQGFEQVIRGARPDGVIVAGDVNSTLACALVAVKEGIRCAHLEAGLRSFDRTMPEEINRVVTDVVSDVLLTPSEDADENLAREGIPAARVFRVGNAMIDSLLQHRPRAEATGIVERSGLAPGGYALATFHRASNVDTRESLDCLLGILGAASERLPVVFPMHPRTRARVTELGLADRIAPAIRIVEPLGYLEFLGLQAGARMVLTDSGGIQEETTALGIPCLTLRANTERPITVTQGTNTVVGLDPARVLAEVDAIQAGRGKRGRVPLLWDGQTGPRVAEVLAANWLTG